MGKPKVVIKANSKRWEDLSAAERRNFILAGIDPYDYECQRGMRLYSAGKRREAKAAYASAAQYRPHSSR